MRHSVLKQSVVIKGKFVLFSWELQFNIKVVLVFLIHGIDSSGYWLCMDAVRVMNEST